MEPELIKWIASMGSFGVCTAVLWFLLTRTIPALSSIFQSESESNRKTFRETIDSLHQRMSDRDEKIINALTELRRDQK
jgi:hypothetical protein